MLGTHRAALVFAAAPVPSTPRLSARLAALRQPYVVAADGGAATALAFGFQPDVVVGDMDSIAAPTLADLQRRRVPIETHPRDKDATDGQLAIDRAVLMNPVELLLLGFMGGPRLDQALANVFLLARLDRRAVLLDRENECTLVQPGAEHAWRTEADEVVSLIPLTADVSGVFTTGLRWALHAERLTFGDTRGISNEPAAPEASVRIAQGKLLVTRHFPREL